MNTVLDFLERSAAVYPDREAYEDEKKLLTFAQTRDLARAVGTALQEKIRLFQKIAQDSCGRDEDESGNQGNT